MLLLRGATLTQCDQARKCIVSIHAPLARSNTRDYTKEMRDMMFQYMLLLRGATKMKTWRNTPTKFQYMLLLRGATLFTFHDNDDETVSIHAPLARSNSTFQVVPMTNHCFNTCSSCEEQQKLCGLNLASTLFQYMLLLRGATGLYETLNKLLEVSIHAPLARSNSIPE